jgi:hypothetical protein
MPVPIAKVKEALNPLGDRILALLGKDPGSALTIFEIIAPLEGWESGTVALVLLAERSQVPSSPTFTRYADALAELVATGRVTMAPYQGGNVYFLTGAT